MHTPAVVSVSLDAKKQRRRRSRDLSKSSRSYPENAALRELALSLIHI